VLALPPVLALPATGALPAVPTGVPLPALPLADPATGLAELPAVAGLPPPVWLPLPPRLYVLPVPDSSGEVPDSALPLTQPQAAKTITHVGSHR
jgi:hypothetical protein